MESINFPRRHGKSITADAFYARLVELRKELDGIPRQELERFKTPTFDSHNDMVDSYKYLYNTMHMPTLLRSDIPMADLLTAYMIYCDSTNLSSKEILEFIQICERLDWLDNV